MFAKQRNRKREISEKPTRHIENQIVDIKNAESENQLNDLRRKNGTKRDQQAFSDRPHPFGQTGQKKAHRIK